MALAADIDLQRLYILGRARLKALAAGADDRDFMIFRMNVLAHIVHLAPYFFLSQRVHYIRFFCIRQLILKDIPKFAEKRAGFFVARRKLRKISEKALPIPAVCGIM